MSLNPAYLLQRCLRAVPFLIIPWTMPYRKGCYCATNRSEIMRIDTDCGLQWVGFGVYRYVLQGTLRVGQRPQ